MFYLLYFLCLVSLIHTPPKQSFKMNLTSYREARATFPFALAAGGQWSYSGVGGRGLTKPGGFPDPHQCAVIPASQPGPLGGLHTGDEWWFRVSSGGSHSPLIPSHAFLIRQMRTANLFLFPAFNHRKRDLAAQLVIH